MQIKRVMFVFFSGLMALSISAWSKSNIGDPLQFPIPVSPSVLNPGGEAMMDYSAVQQASNYLVTCSVETHADNDPIYFLLHHDDAQDGCGYISGTINVDKQPCKNKYEAFIENAGQHIITFSLLINFYCPDRQNKYFTLSNASDDVIDITNCHAEFN